jgi:hypothetical protein
MEYVAMVKGKMLGKLNIPKSGYLPFIARAAPNRSAGLNSTSFMSDVFDVFDVFDVSELRSSATILAYDAPTVSPIDYSIRDRCVGVRSSTS